MGVLVPPAPRGVAEEEAPEERRRSIPSSQGRTRSLGRFGMCVDELFLVVAQDMVCLRSMSIRPVVLYQEFRVVQPRRVFMGPSINAIYMYCIMTVCMFFSWCVSGI